MNDAADAGLYAGVSKGVAIMYAGEALGEYDSILAAEGRHEEIIVFVIDLQILEAISEDMPIAGEAPEKSHFEASLDELGEDTGAEEAS